MFSLCACETRMFCCIKVSHWTTTVSAEVSVKLSDVLGWTFDQPTCSVSEWGLNCSAQNTKVWAHISPRHCSLRTTRGRTHEICHTNEATLDLSRTALARETHTTHLCSRCRAFWRHRWGRICAQTAAPAGLWGLSARFAQHCRQDNNKYDEQN